MDSRSNFLKEYLTDEIPVGHKRPSYSLHDVSFNHNSKGYRCPEFDVVAGKRVISIGCSYVYGSVVSQDLLFHEIVAKDWYRQDFVNWNLGIIARSNDYICRMLHLSLPVLKPDLVLVNFTFSDRREYFDANGRVFSWRPNLIELAKGDDKELCQHLLGLSNEYDDMSNFLKNYLSISHLLRSVNWFWSANEEAAIDLVDDRRCVGIFPTLDLSPDNNHPGPESHAEMARLYLEKMRSWIKV